MVSAASLNYDCLELIFAYLSGNDLVSVSLVCRSFLAGVIPRLYRTLFFKLNQSKRYPAILSPFATVLAHRNLANHIRYIDIRSVPTVKANANPHPEFLRDCSRVIKICDNLLSFTCTPNILPSFLLELQLCKSLQHLWVNAAATAAQTEELFRIQSLKSLTLDTGTPFIANALPAWTVSMRSTLTNLTIYSMHDLNECVLESVLSNVPNLKALHVVGCSKIDHYSVLSQLSRVPLLESLAFTSWESPRSIPPDIRPLRRLRHLAVDTHCSLSPNTTPSLWNSIISLTRAWSCPLKSVTLKLSDKLLVGDSFIQELLQAHDRRLTHLALLNFAVSMDSIRAISRRCDLKRLAISVPVKDIYGFAEALTYSVNLRTLSDVGDTHASHGQKVFIARHDIMVIMESVRNLETVITDGRVWTAEGRRYGVRQLKFEKRKTLSAHWFMPPLGVLSP